MFATQFSNCLRRPLSLARKRAWLTASERFPSTLSGEDITYSKVYTIREQMDGDLDRDEIDVRLERAPPKPNPAFGHYNNLNDLILDQR